MSAFDLYSLAKEASGVQSSDYIRTVEKAISFLRSEKGQVGNLTVTNHLVMLEPCGEAIVIGDLHGDLESLVVILQKSGFLESIRSTKNLTLIFLGDYGDRGSKSAEVYFVLLKLKLAYPKQVVLLRGNHEGPMNLQASPHDLPFQFQDRFGDNWDLAYQKTRDLWSCLYNAVYVEDRYLMLHGGLSPEIRSLQDIANADENYNETLLADLLWSDPDETTRYISPSPRGAGKLFGKIVTEEVLRRVNANILIRGHESSMVGFKINHGDRVLTLFSRKGSPYFNQFGTYLELNLSEKFESIQQLIPSLHKF